MRLGRCQQRRLGVPGRERVVRRDAVGDGMRRRQQVVGIVQRRDQPPRESLVGGEDPARQQQLGRSRMTDDLGQAPRGSCRRDDPETRFGVADLGRVRGDADVGRIRELCPATERPAVDRGDDGHRQAPDAAERGRVDALARVVGTAVAKLGDVGARREDAACAGQDEHERLGFQLCAQRVERIDELLVDRVAGRGPVEGRNDPIGHPLDPQGRSGLSHRHPLDTRASSHRSAAAGELLTDRSEIIPEASEYRKVRRGIPRAGARLNG